MSDDFQSHEQAAATKLNRGLTAGRAVGRARRITTSSNSASTTAVAVLELDDISIKSGRLYKIETSGVLIDTSVANDVGAMQIRYTTDGSTPTISSTILPGAFARAKLVDASFAESRAIHTTYTPAADQTLSLLLCVLRETGSGNVNLVADGAAAIIEMCIYDRGEDPGDTGVDL